MMTLLALIVTAWLLCVLASVTLVAVAAHIVVAVLWVYEHVRKVFRSSHDA
jgi:hypothetical protein